MIEDILDSLSIDSESSALEASGFNMDEALSLDIELGESIASSTIRDEVLSMPSPQIEFQETSSNGILDLFPDGTNQNLEQGIVGASQMNFPNQIGSLFASDYLDTSNPLDVDNLLNIPHTDGLNLSHEDIDQLNDRTVGINRDDHRSDISFGKKGDPGECCTRHCCTGASYCDASYGDFHR